MLSMEWRQLCVVSDNKALVDAINGITEPDVYEAIIIEDINCMQITSIVMNYYLPEDNQIKLLAHRWHGVPLKCMFMIYPT